MPKQFPPNDIDQLRNISGLLNLDKVAEKLISRLIISDMKAKLDPSQYANHPGLSIQHYLIRLIDRILEALDKNSKGDKCAVLATLVDWKQAFPRQCPKLGVESFLKNGVRPALIPLLVNYFQGRQIKVKWFWFRVFFVDTLSGGSVGHMEGFLLWAGAGGMITPHLVGHTLHSDHCHISRPNFSNISPNFSNLSLNFCP